MSETKFTPGPWVYRSKTREIGTVDKSDTQSYGMLLVVAYIDGFDHEEHEANAHLIAAAPDLYDALQNLLSRLANDADGHAWFMDEQEASIIALAKARGES